MFFACVGFYLQPSIVYNPHGLMWSTRGFVGFLYGTLAAAFLVADNALIPQTVGVDCQRFRDRDMERRGDRSVRRVEDSQEKDGL